jgi:hypothetical protein
VLSRFYATIGFCLAAAAALERGVVWLHVDHEPHLERFYRACGFEPTLAGLLRLDGAPPS